MVDKSSRKKHGVSVANPAVLAIHFENSIAIHFVLKSTMMRLFNSMESLTRKCENGRLCAYLSLHLKLKVTCVYIGNNSKGCPGIIKKNCN